MPNVLALFSRWAPVTVWMVLVFVGSSFSSRPGPQLTPYSPEDLIVSKSPHVVEYMILAFLLIRAQKAAARPITRRVYLIAFIVATLYAALDEFHQSFVPGRTASVWDVTVDSVGAAVAVTIACLTRGRTIEQ